jgi:hypothetical protein
MSDSQPSTSDANGRDARGRFGVGNRAAKGNPFARRVAQFRAAMFKAVKPDQIQAVVASLLKLAQGGDVPAARELLNRLLGPPQAEDFVQRLDELEQRIAQLQERRHAR